MEQASDKKPARKGKAKAPAGTARTPKSRAATLPVTDQEITETRELKKKELVERVSEAAGVKKKDARGVIEAALAEMGAALSRGETLNLPPLGKVKVKRQNEKESGEVLVVKLRRSGGQTAGAGADLGLAEAGD